MRKLLVTTTLLTALTAACGGAETTDTELSGAVSTTTTNPAGATLPPDAPTAQPLQTAVVDTAPTPIEQEEEPEELTPLSWFIGIREGTTQAQQDIARIHTEYGEGVLEQEDAETQLIEWVGWFDEVIVSAPQLETQLGESGVQIWFKLPKNELTDMVAALQDGDDETRTTAHEQFQTEILGTLDFLQQKIDQHTT